MDWLRSKFISRKTAYPHGTKRAYLIGGSIALAISLGGILIAYTVGAYDGPGEWVYALINPWHLVTLVGLYYVGMAYLIKEKGAPKK